MGARCITGSSILSYSKKHKIFQPKLNDDEINVLCENTEFDRNDVEKLYSGFLKDCPDGYLSSKRLNSFYSTLCPGGDAAKFADAAFRAFDTNKDGKISFNEFVIAMSFIKSKDLDKQLGVAFDLFDLDKDKYVTKQEIIKLLNAVYDMNGIAKNERTGEYDPKKKAETIVRLMDKSGDGKISKSEFLSTCREDEGICTLFASTVNGGGR